MRNSLNTKLLAAKLAVITLALAALGSIASAQQSTVGPPVNRAVGLDQSRAERAAEDMVSLSADKILDLLRNEAGLLLQVKKVLVRKAYEQGRLLDPKDLTDDSVFQLVREDENVRVLITHEIEDRYYIRVKPSREDLERGLISEPLRGQPPKEGATDQVKQPKSQEEAYWAQHEGAEERYPEKYQRPYGSSSATPSGTQPATSPSYAPSGPANGSPQEPSPQEPQKSLDPSQQLERTGIQNPQDYSDSLGLQSSQMSQIRPEELPQVLSASSQQSAQRGGAAGNGNDNGRELLASGSVPADTSSLSFPPASAMEMPYGNRDEYALEASSPNPTFRSRAWFAPRRPQQPALRRSPDPYADVPSLYDLYSQYSERPALLERFGADIFRNGTGNFNQLPMDIPAGPEYVLGPGDGLSIELWGGVSQRLVRAVDREGRVALPEVGTLEVSGKSLGDVQRLIQTQLRSQFRDVQADVSLTRLRSVRVYVVGDVERAGAYDVSALSTPLNAVYMAGGPTSAGSLRTIRHYRGKELVQQVDVYGLLLHGIQSDLKGLQSGDTILVPPLGPEVTVEGMVRRPAIYELDGEKSLAEVLELAGGVMRSGTLRHVDVERVQAHQSRTMLRLDIPEDDNHETVTQTLADFQIQDGDKIKISPILPYADKTVYLEGHVFRPGKFAYRDGMKVSDVIHSYNELLPEPYKSHAEIIRLRLPDYTPTVLAFNLEDALSGKQDVALKPFDTIRVFGRYDFEDAPVVTVTGEVRDPGDHITNGATYLRDAVYLAGGATPDAELSDAQVFRKTDDGKLEVISVDLSKALAGDAKDNVLLESKDRIFIHRNLSKMDPATVAIEGEVGRPGKYPLGDNLTAAGLVRLAGGLKRGAYTEEADLTRYEVRQGNEVVGERIPVALAKALAEEPDSDVRLHDGDVLTIRQLAGWNDIGATIAVKGEVAHPGTYGIQEGERLSSILARAGGLRSDAYPYGTIFERTQVRELEEKSRGQLIRELQEQGAALRQAPDTDADEKSAKAAALQQWQSTLDKLQNTPPEGRLVIHISSNPKRWVNTSADIQVRSGDSIYVPKKPNTVIVDGSVYNPTGITYRPGRDAGWYLQQAGGPTNMANKKATFVIRADGSVVGGSGGLFAGGVSKAALQPGDMIVVPEKAFSANSRFKSVLEGSQIAYAVGIAIQVARSF